MKGGRMSLAKGRWLEFGKMGRVDIMYICMYRCECEFW